MLLIVDDDRASYARTRSILGGRRIARAVSLAEARERCRTTDPMAVLLGRGLDRGDVEAFVRDLRAGEFGWPGRPVVAVVDREIGGTGFGADETIAAPVDEQSLPAAIERAILLGEYEDAIGEFFDACRERADRDRTYAREFEGAREHADLCLAALSEREGPMPFERLIGVRERNT